MIDTISSFPEVHNSCGASVTFSACFSTPTLHYYISKGTKYTIYTHTYIYIFQKLKKFSSLIKYLTPTVLLGSSDQALHKTADECLRCAHMRPTLLTGNGTEKTPIKQGTGELGTVHPGVGDTLDTFRNRTSRWPRYRDLVKTTRELWIMTNTSTE